LRATFPHGFTIEPPNGLFTLTVINPCLTTTWVARTINVPPISVMTTYEVDLTIFDKASSDYGNQDGTSLCGPRTYTWFLNDNKSFITQLDTLKTGDTLKF